jgi:hypothetical protein
MSNMDQKGAKALMDKGFVAVVYVAYAYADKEVGEIISKHKSYEAADAMAKQSTFWGIRYLDSYMAQCGD